MNRSEFTAAVSVGASVGASEAAAVGASGLAGATRVSALLGGGLGLAAPAAIGWPAAAQVASILGESETALGVRAALQRGALAAGASLGRSDGFMGNDLDRIPLPGFLQHAAKLLTQP